MLNVLSYNNENRDTKGELEKKGGFTVRHANRKGKWRGGGGQKMK
jgi:hypothetical protein